MLFPPPKPEDSIFDKDNSCKNNGHPNFFGLDDD